MERRKIMRGFEIVRLSNNTFSIYLVEQDKEQPLCCIVEWLTVEQLLRLWRAINQMIEELVMPVLTREIS